MSKIISIGALLALMAATWQMGASISHDSMWLAFGLLLGVFVVGLPTALIVASVTSQRARLDIYHHTATETPREPVQQPTALTVQPERFIVLDNAKRITTANQARLEVSQ